VNAVISGQAGVAVLVDGMKLASIHAGSHGEVIDRRPQEVRFLLNDALDLEFLENIGPDEASRRLETATAKYDALHLALILLDEELSSDTRQTAAQELEELLGEGQEVADFPARVLFSRPFPRGADPAGARACCTVQTPRVRGLIENLVELQPVISEVFQAWQQIQVDVFGSKEDRIQVLATAVKEGIFRDFVLLRAADSTAEAFRALALLKPSFVAIKKHRLIIRKWLSALQVRNRDRGLVRPPTYASRMSVPVKDDNSVLRILCLADQHEANLASDLERAIRLFDLRTEVEVFASRDATLKSLRQAILETNFDVLHFSGHGAFDVSADKPVLFIDSDDGAILPLRSADLVRALDVSSAPRLIVLQACASVGKSSFEPFSQMARALAQQGIPAVLAVQSFVASGVTRIAFAHFYRLLAAGYSIVDSMTPAVETIKRMELTSHANLDWVTPVLFMRTARGELKKERWDGPDRSGRPRRSIRWLGFRRKR